MAYDPGAQLVQAPSPLVVATAPGAQVAHGALIDVEYCPAGHVEQPERPLPVAYDPAAQLEQALSSLAVATVPGAQVEHAELLAAEYCPAGHVAQVSPVVGEARPAGHPVVGQFVATVPPGPEKYAPGTLFVHSWCAQLSVVPPAEVK